MAAGTSLAPIELSDGEDGPTSPIVARSEHAKHTTMPRPCTDCGSTVGCEVDVGDGNWYCAACFDTWEQEALASYERVQKDLKRPAPPSSSPGRPTQHQRHHEPSTQHQRHHEPSTQHQRHHEPSAWSDALNALGWPTGLPGPASPRALELKGKFENNGLNGGRFEVCDGAKIAAGDEAETARATTLFLRDGFVPVCNVLNAAELAFLRTGCEDAITQIVAKQSTNGNRGTLRYSFGGASSTESWAHREEWTQLIDQPAITPVLKRVLGAGYTCRSVGGDFVLPGCLDYQSLHSDLNGKMHWEGANRDNRVTPCGWVAVNYLPQAFTKMNAPIRQIPAAFVGGGTQNSKHAIPKLHSERDSWKLATLCPLPAGSAVIRDIRAWHGGTPNVSQEVRAIPNAEFYAEWVTPRPGTAVKSYKKSMPYERWLQLSPDARERCRNIVLPRGKAVPFFVKSK